MMQQGKSRLSALLDDLKLSIDKEFSRQRKTCGSASSPS
jgi:hypothetical protein